MIEVIQEPHRKIKIAETILHALPEWFGIPESTQTYIDESRELPFWAAIDHEQPVGFLCLKPTSPHTIEIYVMGLLKSHQHLGIGTRLYKAAEQYATTNGYSFMQVKTVKQGTYAIYDETNRFYQHLGFKELECFLTLWDPHNPCQIYIKALN